MVLSKIALHNFRNVHNASYTLHENLTVIRAANASGKTNILEGMYVLCVGHGFREQKEVELVRLGQTQASVEGIVHDKHGGEERRGVLLQSDSTGHVKKTYLINKAKKAARSYTSGGVQAVLFAPEHIEILTGSPDRRRQYLNTILSGYDPEYKKRLTNYEQALRRRNKLFDSIEDVWQLEEELQFWNTYMIEQAAYVSAQRQQYIDHLNTQPELESKRFECRYIANAFDATHLEKSGHKELAARRTLIGPQKDDFQIYMQDDRLGDVKLIDTYGSRSEQRLGMIWLKRAEMLYAHSRSPRDPLVLLDDVFSEFDDENRELVMRIVAGHQVIATTTESPAHIKTIVHGPHEIISL
jgi:DNA replication and repair protein RecF